MPDKKSSAARGTVLLTMGFVLFAVAWFVPTVRTPDFAGGALGSVFQRLLSQQTDGPDWLPGWSAVRVAWQLLVHEAPPELDMTRARVLGATCLTNLVMLTALVVVAGGVRDRRGLGAVTCLLLLGSCALDSTWLWYGDKNAIQQLGVGYWLWTVSFALTGVGVGMRSFS